MTNTTYDPSADALYVYLGHAEIDSSEEVAPDDRDAEGRIVGLEFTGASVTLAPGRLDESTTPR